MPYSAPAVWHDCFSCRGLTLSNGVSSLLACGYRKRALRSACFLAWNGSDAPRRTRRTAVTQLGGRDQGPSHEPEPLATSRPDSVEVVLVLSFEVGEAGP